MKSEKQLSIFGKQKSTKVLQIFAFQKIASGIDAEALKCSSASITDAIWPDCWTHYNIQLNNNVININYTCKPSYTLNIINKKDNNLFTSEDTSFLPILFSNSIDHILFAKPFFMTKKNIPLRKLGIEYFKDDLKKYGIDVYKL